LAWTCTYLKNAGFITNVKRGKWALTGQGRNAEELDVEDIKRAVRTGLIVRPWNDQILVEQDTNEPPLVDSLIIEGVPRSMIILAYAGEPVPESV
jgi:hypothetical protein